MKNFDAGKNSVIDFFPIHSSLCGKNLKGSYSTCKKRIHMQNLPWWLFFMETSARMSGSLILTQNFIK